MASCTADVDCRAAEGYVCDRAWRACVIPNSTVIIPRACPPPRGIGRDPGFAPSIQLSTATSPGASQLAPSAVITPDGSLVTIYGTRTGAAAGNVPGLARIDPLGRPTLDTPIVSPRTYHADPWLARDARGTLIATWVGFDDGDTHREIALATSRDAGLTWSAPVAVHETDACTASAPDRGVACLARPMVVSGPDPDRRGAELVHLMYAAAGLRVRTSDNGGKTFGPARTALAGSYGNATVGADGRLHAVAIDGGAGAGFGTGDHRIHYTVSADGGRSFARPITVSRDDETLPYFFANPSIAVDTRRRWLYIAYVRGGRDARWDLVLAASRNGGQTWSRTRIGDDPACAIHMVPNLALDPTTGRLHLAWYDSRGPDARFAHAICGPGATRCTQLGRINDLPFAALSTTRDGARSIGDHQALFVDDKRRTLHAVWTQPIAALGGTITSRIFHARATLR